MKSLISFNFQSKQKIYLKHQNLKIISLLFFSLCFESISAQEGFVITGGELLSSNGSLTYSIGQIFYDVTSSDDSFYINQGLQIPYQTSIDQPLKIKLDVLAFPNPTISNINISIKDYDFQNQDLEYYLLGIDGKLIQKDKISNKLTTISIENLPKGIYVLHVIGSVVHANLKIIKLEGNL